MTRFYVYTAGGFLGYVDAVDRVQATTALQREFPHWDWPNAVFRLSLTPPPPQKTNKLIKLQITDHFGGWITLFEREAKDYHESVSVQQLVQLKINEIRYQAKDPRVSRNFPPRGKTLRKTVNGLVQYEEHFRSTSQGIS